MYIGLLHTHSMLRYLVLIMLLVVIVNSFIGMTSKKPFGKTDNLLGLTLFSATHTQLLIGLLLFFVSPFVSFSGEAMKNQSLRYWTTEHSLMMLIAIVLITMARITAKKMTDDGAKHKRMFVFNALALLIILVAIAMSGRGFLSLPGMSTGQA